MVKILRLNIILAVIFYACSLSCKEEVTISNTDTEENQAFKSSKIEVSASVELTKEAQQITRNWLAYITLHSEIERFRGSSLGDVINTTETTLEIIKNLKGEIPEKFRTKPVNARISVLVTLAYVLNQEATERTPDYKKLQLTTEKIIVAFNNLNIQLNEATIDPLKNFELSIKKPDSLVRKPILLKEKKIKELNKSKSIRESDTILTKEN